MHTGVLHDLTLPAPLILSPIFLSLTLYTPAPLDLFLSLPQAFVALIHSAWTTLSWTWARLPLLIQLLTQKPTTTLCVKILFCLPRAFNIIGNILN